MSTLIDKIFDILMKQQQLRKIPQVMMIISIFTLIFPNEAIEVKNILINKGSLLLPTPLVNTLQNCKFHMRNYYLFGSFSW